MPTDRRDPWGDLIRGKKVPYLEHVGLTEANVRLLPVRAGPRAIMLAPKYGISMDDAASTDPEVRTRNYEKLVAIQRTWDAGVNALRIVGTGMQKEAGVTNAKLASDIRAAGYQAGQMGEAVVAGQFFKAARALETNRNARIVSSATTPLTMATWSQYESNSDAQIAASTAYWITQFKSSLGWGEAEFAQAAHSLLSTAAEMSLDTVDNERRMIRRLVRVALTPGVNPSESGLLHPESLGTLSSFMEAERLATKKAASPRIHPGGFVGAVMSSSDMSPMEASVHAVRDHLTTVLRNDLPENFRDLERWKAVVENDLEDSLQAAFVASEGLKSTDLYSIRKPVKNFPVEPVRGAIQGLRKWARPIEPAGAFMMSWANGINKISAAANITQSIDMEERKRLVEEAYKHFQDPFTTVIGGDRPYQTWNEFYGKNGESIAMFGEGFEKAGKVLQQSHIPGHKALGRSTEKFGKLIRENAKEISPWAETGAFLAPALFMEGPAGLSPLAGSIRTSATARNVYTAANLAPLAATTPENLWPMLIPFAGRAAGRRLSIPQINQHTGEIMLPNYLANRAVVQKSLPIVQPVMRAIHPLPSSTVDAIAMQKMVQGQYQPDPITDPTVAEEQP